MSATLDISRSSSVNELLKSCLAKDEKKIDNDEDLLPETTLSLYLSGNKFAAAYFEHETNKLFILEDCDQSLDDCSFIPKLIQQVRPTVVLASLKQDYRLTFHLKRYCSYDGALDDETFDGDTTTDEHSDKPKLVLLHSKLFDIEQSKQKISEIFTRDTGKNLGDVEKRLKTSFSVNFDCINLVRCLGGLIGFLNLSRITETKPIDEIGDDSSLISNCAIFSVSTFTLEKIVLMDHATLAALQIFQHKFHPSVYKFGQGGAKEGLSVFALCNRCVSSPGARELRRWFFRPYCDKEVLEDRFEAISFLMAAQNAELVSAMRKALKSVKYITKILTHMQQLQASVANWFTLYKTVYHCINVAELIQIRQSRPKLLTDLTKYFTGSIYRIGLMMGKIVDFENMHSEERFCVKLGVDKNLDEKKRIFANLAELMNDFVRTEVKTLPFTPSKCCMVYIPIVGYLLMLPVEENLTDCLISMEGGSSELLTLLQKPGIEFVFSADGFAYYKSPGCLRLDSAYGDIKLSIVDMETTIMIRLQNIILDGAGALVDAVRACAQLDWEFNWVRPIIADQDDEENEGIFVEKGRHPLLEVCTSQFVPNSTSSSSRDHKVHILTGPNASGKSIYLKQVGILMYLAHIGSFVPASSARLSLLDGIFTRIHSVDSVLDGMSTFAVDVRQMSSAMADASGRSLVIVDEFGKGTLTEVGLSLLQSCLELWLAKGPNCPHLFVSTHFYSLLWSLKQTPFLKYQTLETARKGADFVFLHQLVDGFIDCAYAAQVASALGLGDKIIDRSLQIYNLYKHGDWVIRPNENEDAYKREMEKYEAAIAEFLTIDLEDDEFTKFLENADFEFEPITVSIM